jgi:2-oxoglutarate ferredoxin oxidoreductase subunit gamma
MRGGTANVTVILSDERISSPILNQYDTGILLNQQSLDKFEQSVKPGGILIFDPNGITRPPLRKDIQIYQVEAATEAGRMMYSKTFNMIVWEPF